VDIKKIRNFYSWNHLVTTSPTPFVASIALGIVIYNTIHVLPLYNKFNIYYTNKNLLRYKVNFIFMLLTSIVIISIFLYTWWRDVRRESRQGHHIKETQKLIKIAIIIFILREAFIFFSLFWAYFWYSLNNTIVIGNTWPPTIYDVHIIYPYGFSLVNCTILLSSGVTVTWAHHAIFTNIHNEVIWGIKLTIFLGVLFTVVQFYEFSQSKFTIFRGVIGCIFFRITGLHGIHVIIGTLILYVSYKRSKKGIIRSIHHNNIELSIWYWHFVDVVWLFVYLRLYWWPLDDIYTIIY